MAKAKEESKKVKVKVRRRGIHAKSKMSSLKSSKNYTKKNVGQGK
jgi:hypothetical protein